MWYTYLFNLEMPDISAPINDLLQWQRKKALLEQKRVARTVMSLILIISLMAPVFCMLHVAVLVCVGTINVHVFNSQHIDADCLVCACVVLN